MNLSEDIATISPFSVQGEAEAVNSAQEKKKGSDREPVKVFGIILPDSLSLMIRSFQDWGHGLRIKTIELLPRPIVNHSSQIVGTGQIICDAAMFQSSGINLLEGANRNNPLHYIWYPIKNTGRGVLGNFQRAKINLNNPFSADFYRDFPGRITRAFSELRDLEAATLRDKVVNGETVLLKNKWSARSGLCGMAGMAVAMALPEKKDTPESTQEMTLLAKQHPIKYLGMRLHQALNPIQWFGHTRQIAGFGMTFAGLFSAISAFRQVSGKELGKQAYMFNGAQMFGGLITMLSGSLLALSVDNESGWRNWGSTQMVRLLTLPSSIRRRFEGTPLGQEQGAWWYTGAQAGFQVKNLFSALVGGAEKDKDGHIVDHQAMREAGRVKANSERARLKQERLAEPRPHLDALQPGEAPSRVVSEVAATERAMPERAAQAAANDAQAAVAANQR